MKSKFIIVLVILWAVIALPGAVTLGVTFEDPYKREILLYDLDYRNRTNQIGQTVLIEDEVLPERSSPSRQIFGTTTIQSDPHSHSQTGC